MDNGMTWNIFDSDNDGVKTFKELAYVLRTLIYLFGGIWSILHVEEFSDNKFGWVIVASFGMPAVELFIRYGFTKNNNNGDRDSYADHYDNLGHGQGS